MSPPSPPSLLTLPSELRLEIYAFATSTLHRALYATCSRIRAEGLPRHFTLHFGYDEYIGSFPLPLPDIPATPLVQHVTLHINLSGSEHPQGIDRIGSAFGGREVVRERCDVVLNYGYLGYVSPRIRLGEVFAQVRQLRGFREVGVVLTGAEDGFFFGKREIRWMYGEVERVLREGLGRGRVCGDGGRRLVFRPRDGVVG